MNKNFSDATAFRRSLEQRLNSTAREVGAPLNRMRKEAASQRLLARLAATLPENSWALKGGLALISRLDTNARATKDIDTTWRYDASTLSNLLDDALDHDLGDHFEFTLGPPRPIEAEGPEGSVRYRIVAYLDGREFERLQLDINVVPGDHRPTEQVKLKNPFSFANIPAPVIPIVSVGQHLAEKLHAYCRSYGSQVNSRAKDLYDMLVIAEQLPLPRLAALHDACIDTFDLRNTSWPPLLIKPPQEWEVAWGGFVNDYAIEWTSLTTAYTALQGLWLPVLSDIRIDASWQPPEWAWSE